MNALSEYRMFNPYKHLTQSFQLTQAGWQRVKRRLSPSDLAAVEHGGVVSIGAAAKVWKPAARKEER